MDRISTQPPSARPLVEAARQGAWLGIKVAVVYSVFLIFLFISIVTIQITFRSELGVLNVDKPREIILGMVFIAGFGSFVTLLYGVPIGLVLGALSEMILYVVLSLFRVRLSPNLAGLIGLSVTLCIGVSIWLISLRLDPTRLSLILVLPATPIYTLAGAFAARSLYQRYFKPSSP